MTPTIAELERTANHAAAHAEQMLIDNIAAFVAGCLSSYYGIDANPATPDLIVTPYAPLLRRADGWYSGAVTAEPLMVGTATYRGGPR